MSTDMFEARRKALEEAFFQKQNAELVDKIRTTFLRKATREELRKFTGISNEEVLDRLVALNVSGETLAAFNLLPLVEVAWADGKVDDKEREVIVNSLAEEGIHVGTTAYNLLLNALEHRPTVDGRKAWYAYAEELKHKLTAREREAFVSDLLRKAHAVAAASGGLLDLAFTVSPAEKRVLEAIEKAFAV